MLSFPKFKLPVFADVLCFLALFICALKLTWNLENIIDLPDNPDELFYFISGINFFKHLPDANWGLLYSLWYNFLSLFFNNNIETIYFNISFLHIINPCLIYLLLRSFNIRYDLAFIFCLLYLISPLNLPVQPKVSNFLSICLLIMYFFISRNKEIFSTILIATLGAYIVTYIRPEFKLSFILLFILFLVVCFQKLKFKSFTRLNLKYSIITMIVFVTLFLWWGNVFNDNAKRKYVAFGQHFSYNYSLWNKTNNDPFTDWEIVNKTVFNNATTFQESIQSNPVMFGKHLLFNFRNYLGGITKEIIGLPFPKQYFCLKSYQYILFSGILILILILLNKRFNLFNTPSNLIKRKGNIKIQFSEISDQSSTSELEVKKKVPDVGLSLFQIKLFIGLAFFIPTFLAIIIMASRMHYLVAQFPSLLFLFCVLFFSGLKETNKVFNNYIFLIIIFVFGYILTPSPDKNKLLLKDHSLINLTQSLEQLKISKNIIASGSNNFLVNLIYPKAVSIPYWDKKESTYSFILNKRINLFMVTKIMTDDRRFRDDMEWHDFVKNHQKFNFKKIEIPGSVNYILIRNDLL